MIVVFALSGCGGLCHAIFHLPQVKHSYSFHALSHRKQELGDCAIMHGS